MVEYVTFKQLVSEQDSRGLSLSQKSIQNGVSWFWIWTDILQSRRGTQSTGTGKAVGWWVSLESRLVSLSCPVLTFFKFPFISHLALLWAHLDLPPISTLAHHRPSFMVTSCSMLREMCRHGVPLSALCLEASVITTEHTYFSLYICQFLARLMG